MRGGASGSIEPSDLARRSITTAATLFTLGANVAADAAFYKALKREPEPWKVALRINAKKIADAAEYLGPTYIKFGQALALQPDILSLEYCNELFDLLDKVSPFPYDQVESRIVEELGRPPEELFD